MCFVAYHMERGGGEGWQREKGNKGGEIRKCRRVARGFTMFWPFSYQPPGYAFYMPANQRSRIECKAVALDDTY